MVAAMAARAWAERSTIAWQSGSHAAANSATTGASRANPAAPKPGSTTKALSAWVLAGSEASRPRACQSLGRRGPSGRRPSAICRLRARPSRPMSMAEPAPSSSQPQPEQRCSWPAPLRPTAIVPVPLITTMPPLPFPLPLPLPAPPPMAPRRAVRSSPVTATRFGAKPRAAAAMARPWACRGLPASMPLAPIPAARSVKASAPG